MPGLDALLPRLKALRLLSLDVDGVLTDGRLYFSAAGDEYKVFHVRDGQGIQRLQQGGVAVAFLSARESAAVSRRAEELGVSMVRQGCADKAAGLADFCRTLGCTLDCAAHMGDDLGDLAALAAAGFAAAPADAEAAVREASDWVAQCRGGRGAVRELCELILAAREQDPD